MPWRNCRDPAVSFDQLLLHFRMNNTTDSYETTLSISTYTQCWAEHADVVQTLHSHPFSRI